MKKSIFLFFAAILCAMNASAWSYKTAANSWKASTSGFTWVTMNSGKSVDVVMLKDVGDGVNICQNDDGSGHTLYCKWTKTSGDIFRGTARWNNGLYSDETVVVPGGKVYIKVGSGTQVQMTAGADYTYTADVTFSNTGESYTISGGTVNGATIEAQNSMPSGGKPASLTMSNSYTSKKSGNVHIVFDLKTNKVTETADSEPEPEPEPTVTLYFVNHPEWTNLKAHVWDNNDTPYKDWNNSESMTNTGLDKDGYAVYSYTFPSKYTNIIFKGDGQQTQNNVAAYDVAKPYFCDDEWYASLAEIPALGVVVTYDYYVIGTVNGWALKDANFGMTDDNADGVYEKVVTLADGKNQMKINNGTWDNASTFGYDNLSVAYEGVSRGKDGDDNNIIIDITPGKDITIKFDKNANKITLNGLTEKAPEPTYDYYIAGNMNGWNKASADYGMTDEDADGIYEKEITLAAGQDHQFKVTNGKWGNEENGFDCADVEGAYEEVDSKDGNVLIKLNAETTFTVKFDSNNKRISFKDLTPKEVVTYDYYIAGSLPGTAWQPNSYGLDLVEGKTDVYTATFALEANTDYAFKITDGNWNSDGDNTHEHTALATTYVGVSHDNDGNIAFKLSEAKELVVTFNSTEDKIYLNLDEETASLTYRVQVPEGTEACFIAGPCGDWSFREMTREGETDIFKIEITGAKETDEYKYACQADWAYAEVIEGGGNRTAWKELDQVEEWGEPVVVTYQLKGVGGWEQPGIEMEQNPGKASEYMLTCQAISATDAIKVVRLENGEIKDYYGNGTVKDGVAVAVNYDGAGNITLPAGTYNFYFDTNEPEKKLWIAAATDCQTVTEITLTEGDNSSALATEGVVTVTVDRDFEKGKLYTIALPFTINTAASVFGNGTVVYNFANLAYDKTNEEYILGFTKVSKIEAGKPYLIEPGQNVNGFVAENVTLSSATSVSKTVKVDNVEKTATMTAVLSKTTTGGSYWLAEDRYLYNGEVNMPALRALFVLPTTPSGMPARARVALKEDAATGVEDLFTTDAPVKVIQNGQLIIIRDGIKYNVQGQLVK